MHFGRQLDVLLVQVVAIEALQAICIRIGPAFANLYRLTYHVMDVLESTAWRSSWLYPQLFVNHRPEDLFALLLLLLLLMHQCWIVANRVFVFGMPSATTSPLVANRRINGRFSGIATALFKLILSFLLFIFVLKVAFHLCIQLKERHDKLL